MAALAAGKDELVAAMRAGSTRAWPTTTAGRSRRERPAFAGGAGEPRLAVTLSDGGTRVIEAAHYLVATGAAPWIPPITGLADAGYLTSTTAMELTELPESMLVIGGNAVGLELAQLFARLCTQVTIAEALDRLAPFDEPEVSAAIEDVFDDEGIGILTGATITSVRRDATARSVYIKTAAGGERELACGQVLVAAGRRPVTARAEPGNRRGEDRRARRDRHRRADADREPADLGGRGRHRRPAVRLHRRRPGQPRRRQRAGRRRAGGGLHRLPRVTFTSPAIASAGLTEAELIGPGVACDCRVLPLSAVPRAVVGRDTRGVVKLVVEAGTGRLRGVHVVADGAGDMISAAVYAIRAGMTVDDLADTWAPYLTMSEGLRLAAQAFSRDVSRLSCCAA